MPSRKSLLSVAGFDASGGAGVLLDAAVFRGYGFHACAVLTAVTVQNTASVRRVRPLSAALVLEQWRTLAEDIPFAGIKVGMTGTASNLRAIARELDRYPGIPRIVDPVVRSSSGAWLLERAAVPKILDALRGRATLLTPNLEEASRLTGRRVDSPETMRAAAGALFDRTGIPCLIKGGHLTGAAIDVLHDGSRIHILRMSRLRRDVHGTGCHLSASILSELARGASLEEACRHAAAETHEGIRRAMRIGLGRSVFF